MTLDLTTQEFEQTFTVFYGMMLQEITEPSLVAVFHKLDSRAKEHYGEYNYHHLTQALKDDLVTLIPKSRC